MWYASIHMTNSQHSIINGKPSATSSRSNLKSKQPCVGVFWIPKGCQADARRRSPNYDFQTNRYETLAGKATAAFAKMQDVTFGRGARAVRCNAMAADLLSFFLSFFLWRRPPMVFWRPLCMIKKMPCWLVMSTYVRTCDPVFLFCQRLLLSHFFGFP
jgi:hypothetical protein